jgi:hypothetical protein
MNIHTIKKAAVAILASALVLVGASASIAASKVSVDLPNEPVAGGETVSVPMLLTGFTFDKLSVTLVVDEGTLTVTDTDSALTLSPGYTDLANQIEISFNGDAAAVVSVMESGISWTAPGDAATTTALSIRAQVGEYEVGTTYDPATGHSYKYVTTELSWSDAMAAAKLMTYKGKPGYLTNITSAAENTFVANKSGADNVWIGATADLVNVNAALTAASKPTITVDPQVTGEYYWAGGSEGGTQFSTGLGTPAAVGGLYNAWAANEPNNWPGTGEGCGVTNWQGVKGSWNDLDCTRTEASLVEFDTTPGDFETAVVTFDNITGDDTDAVPAEEVVEDVAEETVDERELAATGYDAGIMFALALALMAAGFIVVARVRKN